MLFQNLKAIGEELSEICVLFCKYIYIFIYIEVKTCVLQENPFFILIHFNIPTLAVLGLISDAYSILTASVV
jgi:hypothetical protein